MSPCQGECRGFNPHRPLHQPIMKIQKLTKNNLGRDFVCGDIHGSFSCVQRFLDGVKFDTSKDRLISVGDIVDRGPENEKCLEFLYEPWFFAVKGNHEELMEDFFDHGVNSTTNWWLKNGGGWGAFLHKENSESAFLVRDVLEKKIKELPFLITVERQDDKVFHVLHAEITPTARNPRITDKTLEDENNFEDVASIFTQDGRTITWGRFIFIDFYKKHLDKREILKAGRRNLLLKYDRMFNEDLSHIYSGHTIVTRPLRFFGQTNLDTKAYGSYHLNPKSWCGLTITEPLTDRFWFSNDREFKETQAVIIM